MGRSLLMGCGRDRRKQIFPEGCPEWTGELTTMDFDPNCGADILWDMENRPLPFEDGTFDEIAAYNSMEHWGRQGDFRGWFAEMNEYWRILKPFGLMGVMVPIGADALADPGHTRFFDANYFGFCCKDFYEQNMKQGTCFTDYRWLVKHWWEMKFCQNDGEHHLCVLMRKVPDA